MAKIPVKKLDIFGGSLTPAGNIANFGSLAAAAPAYSGDPATIQSLAAWMNGWAAALINAPGGVASPALEDLNAFCFVLTYQLAYLKQQGLAEWDPTVAYYNGSWAQDGAGIPYVCIQQPNTNHILTDTNWWVPLKSTLVNAGSACKAWVNFDGRTGAINSAFNVSSITRNAVGCYTLNFPASILADNNYSFSGSCGTPNGAVPVAGDNNIVVGGVPGRTVVKTVNQLTVFSWDQNTGLEDSSSISVMIFGN